MQDMTTGEDGRALIDLYSPGADIAAAEAEVRKLVTVPLKPGQFDALVSFVTSGEPLAESRLLERVNANDPEGAVAALDNWVHNGNLHPPELVHRRCAESALFAQAE